MNRKALFSRMKVPLAMLLAMLMLLSCIACGKKEEESDATEDGPQYGENSPLNNLPEADMNRDIVVLSGGNCNDWLIEDSGEPIGYAKYKRTLALEEKYNVSVVLKGSTDSDVKHSLEASTMGDDKAYDLVQPHPFDGMASMMAAGYYANLAAITTMHLDQPWYNQSQVQNYTFANNRLYNAVSDITIDGQGFFGIVYNRDLMLNYQFETDVQTLVENGDWTMETLNEMVKVTEVSGDVGDQGVYGFIFNTVPLYRWMYAMDETLLERTSDGTFVKGYTNNRMTGIANHLYDLMYSHGSTVLIGSSLNAGLATSDMYKAFSGKRGLMIAWDIGAQYGYLRNLGFEIGYAPLPKYDKSQKDYRVNCASGMIGIPFSTKSYEESGMIFEFLAVHSYVYLAPTFYETILGGRLSDYPEDYEMLMLLHSKKYYDLGFTLDEKQNFLGILENLLEEGANPDGIAITLKGKEPLMNQLIDTANGIGVD